jgi:hypothetical protein
MLRLLIPNISPPPDYCNGKLVFWGTDRSFELRVLKYSKFPSLVIPENIHTSPMEEIGC